MPTNGADERIANSTVYMKDNVQKEQCVSALTTSNHATANFQANMPLSVRLWQDAKAWDDFVRSQKGNICHLYAWKKIIEQAYGQQSFFLGAEQGGRLRGVLPLVRTRSPIYGSHLTSMPFLDCGGILSVDDSVQECLWNRALEIAKQQGAKLNLRFRARPSLQVPVSKRRVTMLLELSDSEDSMWARLPSERRNRIRKGQKNGLKATWHREDGLPDFYRVFARNMRDLGSPVHGIGFFQAILQHLPKNAFILLVKDSQLVIGAALCLFFENELSIPWISSLRSYFHRCPNQILYWEAMREAMKRGIGIVDFGRSSRGDGTFEAKRQWGAEPVQLYWVYEPQLDDTLSSASQAGAFVRIWKHIPLSLSNVIGPWIRRGIPG